MAQEYYAASVKKPPGEIRPQPGFAAGHDRHHAGSSASSRDEAQAKFDQLQDLLDPRVASGVLLINQFPDLSSYGLDDKVPQAEVRDVYLHRRA